MEYAIVTSRDVEQGREIVDVTLYHYNGGEKQSGSGCLQIFSKSVNARSYAEREANRRSGGNAQLTMRPSWLQIDPEDNSRTSQSAWVWSD